MSDFLYIDPTNRVNIEKLSQANISKGLYNNYQIGNSCLFNSSSSQYFTRTPSVSGNLGTWTFSCWVKKTKLGTAQGLFTGWDGASTSTVLQFTTGDNLELYNFAGAYYARLITTQVFRDPNAWYHIVAVWDKSNSISSNRQRLYVNGQRISSFSTETYTSDDSYGMNRSGYTQYIGYSTDSYIAEAYNIDGQALEPSSFGYFDNQRDFVWKPKKYIGSYGVNGFYLNFNNSSSLGLDSSGNNNNFTLNGSMSSTNQTSDSPSNNFMTFNPLDNFSMSNSSSNGTISNGNLRSVSSSTSYSSAYSTFPVPKNGKFKFEASVVLVAGGSGNQYIGLTDKVNVVLYWSHSVGIFSGGGTSNSTTYTTNDFLTFEIDRTTQTATFYKNGTQIHNTAFTSTGDLWIISYNGLTSGAGFDVNFGQKPFLYGTSSFKTLSVSNLPTPSIKKSNQYFDVKTYFGTGTTQTIDNLGFSPGLLWTKGRDLGQSHNLIDVIRSGFRLRSDLTNAEAITQVAFTSNGFTLGSETENNNAGSSFVSWAWNIGNTSSITYSAGNPGSIASTVRSNPTAGFSIVSYNGNGTAGSTVAHGLGVKPTFMIIKNRDALSNWIVFHTALDAATGGNGSYLTIANGLKQDTTTNDAENYFGNNTQWITPTSTVFTIGGNSAVNPSNGNKMIAYCWSEIEGYSKFGSYSANNSTDGPFIYCGFRPKFIILRRDNSSTEPWIIKDTSRSIYNGYDVEIYPSSSNIEGGPYSPPIMDYLSNGFKLRSNASGSNGLSGTFIFAAFAETPFKYALAR